MDKLLIGDFEGPLDLLLHLVRQSKMDISEIKIVEITEKYLDFLKEMEDMNLDIASSYLIMASELIEMKSRYLLPRPPKEEDDEYIENPEEELKRRLLLYEQYKKSVSEFRNLEEKRGLYYTKMPERRENYTDEKLENTTGLTSEDLLIALKKLLERKDYSKPINTRITKKELSITERISKIRDILKNKEKVDFLELFDEITKPYVIVTFLGVLEMAKNKEIILKQDKNFDKILLERVG